MQRIQLITTVALVAACAAPVSAVAHYGQALGSPDARDAAAVAETRTYQDLRSPDARDAAAVAETRTYQDLRSPDAKDAGRPNTAPQGSPIVEIRQAPTGGFDWGDAGIGAAGMLALFSIAAGAGLLVTSRRRRRGFRVATR